ncbi:MAG TPA: hypothetical protein VGK48_22550 [Terriglobia bacterium]|jgi:hypothetical protein
MRHPDWTPERTELERVARQYQDKGYDVVVEPGTNEIPDFIREYRPDMIARGSGDCIVIEVRQPATDSERERIRLISERVERQPGWRFVLVSPEEPASSVANIPTDTEVRRLVEEARALTAKGHPEAALLLAWAALEGGMRVAASREGVAVQRPDTWSLMRELVSAGLIDRQKFSKLSDVFKLRSALAHGLQTGNTQAVPGAIDLAVTVASELLTWAC